MNYDITIFNNSEGKGRIEFERIEFLAKHLKSIAQKALLLHLYGYSKVAMPQVLNKFMRIFLTQTSVSDDSTILTLDTENFQHIPMQLDLFKDKQSLTLLSPMALVMQSFTAALSDDDDKHLIDGPLMDELLKFKKFFITDNERIQLTNRGTVSAIEFSRKEIDKVENLYKTIPKPDKTMVAGVIDEMRYSREQVILTTAADNKIVVLVDKGAFPGLKEFFGQEVVVSGMAFFKPGGNLSHVRMESFGNVGKATVFLSKKPDKLSMSQQIALQLREGKKHNPLPNIMGKWPGNETDQEFDIMMKNLGK